MLFVLVTLFSLFLSLSVSESGGEILNNISATSAAPNSSPSEDVLVANKVEKKKLPVSGGEDQSRNQAWGRGGHCLREDIDSLPKTWFDWVNGDFAVD